MKTRPSLLRFGAVCTALACATLGVSARAENKLTDLYLRPLAALADKEVAGLNKSVVRFSDPTKPGTLRLLLPWADVHVTGTDGPDVIVESSLNDKDKGETRDDGLRRLDDEVSFELTEDHNVAVVSIVGENAWAAHGSEFSIKVPRNTNLVVRTEAGGDILVEKVEGDLDINSVNGEVTLRDVASSAVVNTMNGEIHASFKSAPVKPISFSTMNGEISLFLPKDTKANLRMRTHNGSILTDFGADLLKTKNDNRTTAEDDKRVNATADQLVQDHPNISRERAREIAAAALASADADRAAREVDNAARADDRAIRDAERSSRDAEDAARIAKQVAREVAREVSREVARAVPAAAPSPAIAPVPAIAPAAPGEHDDSEFKREARHDIQNAMRAVRDVTRNVGRSIGRSFRPDSGHGPSIGGKSVSGTLNGGGVDISLSSMNGTVTVRKAK